MRRMIERELLQLGAPTGRLGYSQLACAIELILQDPQITCTSRVLYPEVAERCRTKPTRIERNLREEIRIIWEYGNQERLNTMFFNRSKYPPGNKEFLYTFAKHLEHHLIS